MATEDDLISMQVNPEVPIVSGADTATSMLVSPDRSVDRLRHFPEEIYDLRAESHLVRFLKVLLGDAGANQVRKAALLARLRATLQGSHFFDLDRFYGPLFGIRRTSGEVLDFDPQVSTATTSEWDDATSADASFRSRIEQLAKALSYGPTPTGMELIAEAVLSVDCDVYESYVQADASFQTVQEIENQFGPGAPGGFLSDMEDTPLSVLEGAQLTRISGDERRVFTVRPKRAITQQEAYDLRRVLNRVKPADARCIIDFEGIPLHDPIEIGSVAADSEHWEIISEVVSGTDVNSPYPVASDTPAEQPRPPFSGYQGEAWSYNADIIGVSASTDDLGVISVLPTQRVTYYDGSTKDFSADLALLPRRMVQSGRAVSDAVLVTHPYPGVAVAPALFVDSHLIDPNYGLAPLYIDGMPLDELVSLLQTENLSDPFQQNPVNRYWVTGGRYAGDGVDEIVEVRLADTRLVNYLTFEVAHFPHRLVAEAYVDSEWVEVYSHEIPDSFPRVIPQGVALDQRQGHPEHATPAHWIRVGTRIPAVDAPRIRLRLSRTVMNPDPPVYASRDAMGNPVEVEVAYTLAVRSLDLGYRVSSRADFDLDHDGVSDAVISSTRDINGSLVQFKPHELVASNLLGDGYWRSEPQPVNYAVVNLYIDTRADGDGEVIDRWFLDPTHVGCHFTIYFSNDPQDVPDTGDTDAFYEDRTWTPIPRDYLLHKGFVHLPATRARYWKFEFTNLAIEQYESFVPIHRKVRLFPRSVVEAMNRDYARTATEVPQDMLPALAAVQENLYSDALDALGLAANPAPSPDSAAYKATEALYFPSLAQAAKAKDASWVFGFMPWQQSDRAPRFATKGRHVYEVADVVHTSKTAFFVGLKSIVPYRTQWESDDDAQVYYDTFDDFRNLTPGFTWEFNPGYMTTGATPMGTVEATSRVFTSRSDISAVQFATVQSPPVQLVPDHDFRDPALSTYDWADTDYWVKVGDAQLIYSPSDHAVLNVRRVFPQEHPVTTHANGLVDLPSPVFSYRTYDVLDPGSNADALGGLATPPVGLSAEGMAYAAVRFTAITTLSSPLLLQIVNAADDTVLAEKPLAAQKGQTVEDWVGYQIDEADLAVRARLVQANTSDDVWKTMDLAVFEDSIIWEFSNNGGTDWLPAQTIRNNDRGVLTFPVPGNALRYRARSARTNQWVSAIKIRPWYVGLKNARTTGTHRGPNVSVYDADLPIGEDPLFTAWKKPIPAWWFERRQTFPILPVDGAPNVTEFARFYGRPIGDTVPEPTDAVTVQILRVREAEERLDFFNPVTDGAVRKITAKRSATDASAVSGDGPTWLAMYGISKPVSGRIVRPVYSEKRKTT